MHVRSILVLGGLAYFLSAHGGVNIPADLASQSNQYIASADRYMTASFQSAANWLPSFSKASLPSLGVKDRSIGDSGYESFDFSALPGLGGRRGGSTDTLDFGAVAQPKKLSELSFAQLPATLTRVGGVLGLPLGTERDDPLGILR